VDQEKKEFQDEISETNGTLVQVTSVELVDVLKRGGVTEEGTLKIEKKLGQAGQQGEQGGEGGPLDQLWFYRGYRVWFPRGSSNKTE